MKGKRITLVSGARLRRLTEDGKGMLDQRLHEGALVEKDILAKVLHVVESADKKTTAYVVEVPVEGKLLTGWVYSYEIAPGITIVP